MITKSVVIVVVVNCQSTLSSKWEVVLLATSQSSLDSQMKRHPPTTILFSYALTSSMVGHFQTSWQLTHTSLWYSWVKTFLIYNLSLLPCFLLEAFPWGHFPFAPTSLDDFLLQLLNLTSASKSWQFCYFSLLCFLQENPQNSTAFILRSHLAIGSVLINQKPIGDSIQTNWFLCDLGSWLKTEY